MVSSGDVHMHIRGRRALQDTLTAIRLKTPVDRAGHRLHPNGERHLRARVALERIYPPALLRQTIRIAEQINFSLNELRYEYPGELVPSGYTPSAWLRQLTEAGMQRRWPEGTPGHVCRLVDHELELIAELHYEPYFLTVFDIVEFARRRRILCQGTGFGGEFSSLFLSRDYRGGSRAHVDACREIYIPRTR